MVHIFNLKIREITVGSDDIRSAESHFLSYPNYKIIHSSLVLMIETLVAYLVIVTCA